MRSNIRRSLALVAVTALVATAGAAIAFPSQKNVVASCVDGATGQIRIVKSVDHCQPEELPLTWNQEGPMGPQGPEGPAGPAGADGAGTAAIEVSVPGEYWLPEDEQWHQQIAQVTPAGRFAVTGRVRVHTYPRAFGGCALLSGNVVLDYVPFSVSGGSHDVVIPLQAVVDHTVAQTLSIDCRVSNNEDGWVTTSDPKLLITRVGPGGL